MSFRSMPMAPCILPVASASWLSGQVDTDMIVGTISETGASILAANTMITSAGTGRASIIQTNEADYHSAHERVTASPLIAHWPKASSRRNALMPERIELAGATYPDSMPRMKGISVPGRQGNRVNQPDPIFPEHEGNRADRKVKWKPVAVGPNDRSTQYPTE